MSDTDLLALATRIGDIVAAGVSDADRERIEMGRVIDWRESLPTWLSGRQVTVATADHTWSGEVESAGRGRFGQPFVEFTDGRSVDWRNDDPVTVTVEGQ